MKDATTILVLVLLAGSAAAGQGLLAYGRAQPSAGLVVDEAKPERPNWVRVSLEPRAAYARSGQQAVYYVKVVDRHPRPMCAVQEGGEIDCPVPKVVYEVDVSGLPFVVEHPRTIEVEAGGSETFKLVVDTGSKNEPVHNDDEMKEGVENAIAKKGNEVSANHVKAKPYRFKVSVKHSDGYSSSKASARGVLYLTYGSGWPPNPPTPHETVRVGLQKGWNIVSLPGVGRYVRAEEPVMYDASDAEVSSTEVEAMPELHSRKRFFVYLKEEARYATFGEAVRLMGPLGFRKYLMHNAFWVYSPTDDVLVFQVWRATSYKGMPVSKGWNFIPVTKDMAGTSIEETGSSCEFRHLFLFDAGSQQWESIGTEYVFAGDDTYSGIVARAESDCRLGLYASTEPYSPPNLPE